MSLEIFEADELLALAYRDMRAENFQGALEKAKKVLSLNETHAAVYALLGRLYATLSLFERARDSFQLYLKLSPEAYLELFQLGMVEKDLGNYETALEIWERVLELKSDYEEAKFYMGNLLVELERVEDARNCLLDLLETAQDESEFIPLADQLLNRIKAH